MSFGGRDCDSLSPVLGIAVIAGSPAMTVVASAGAVLLVVKVGIDASRDAGGSPPKPVK